jgi:hypothetical protein
LEQVQLIIRPLPRREPGATAVTALLVPLPRFQDLRAVGVVPGALVLVGQDLVGVLDLLESSVGLLRSVLVLVWGGSRKGFTAGVRVMGCEQEHGLMLFNPA